MKEEQKKKETSVLAKVGTVLGWTYGIAFAIMCGMIINNGRPRDYGMYSRVDD